MKKIALLLAFTLIVSLIPAPVMGEEDDDEEVAYNGESGVSSSVPSGKVPYGRMVLLNKASPGDVVYYTTDGSDPRFSFTRKHYKSPIAVTDTLLLKTTAVKYSGTGRAAAGKVSTYRYEPVRSGEPPVGMIDTLDNFKQVAGRSNLYIAKDRYYYFDNDKSRFVRSTASPGTVTYNTYYDINSFLIYGSYFTAGIPLEPLRLHVSPDGKEYTEVNVQSYPVGYQVNNWQKYAYEALSLPEGTRFLKIEMLGSKAWSPHLSQVIINRNTASVKLDTSEDEGAVIAALSSETKDARIYYRLNKGPDFLPYSEPLRLQGYSVLEAYAVKDGMEPSPIQKYSLNAGGDIQVDRFGQMKAANFRGKVASEEELVSDFEADAAYYDSLKPPSDRDRYGGLAGSAEKYGLRRTGFFAIQQLGERKVMTTPEGNLYFSLAVNGVTPIETYTMVKGREDKFESVPRYESEYKNAYIGKGNFSFYIANKYRKTGVFPTEHSIYSEAVERLKKWGFNGVGGYSPEKYGQQNQFPYVRMLPLNSMNWAKLDGISIFDIFAPNAEEKIDRVFEKTLEPYKDDPMLIGYFIDNEYDFHKFYSHVPKLKASKAAIKGRLVGALKTKYRTIDAFNDSWKANFDSFEQLNEAELPLKTSESWRDMDEFYKYYLDTFFGTVSRLYRKYDPNHMLLGDRWITTTFHNKKIRDMLAEAEGKYVDVISINYYTYKIERELFDDLHEKSGGKPILMSEFGYGTAEQGLKPLLPNSAANQFQRGMRYRNYVEGVASLPYVVGTHLFNYVDQAGLGRFWQGEWGERYNSGLLNVADRPYKDYLHGVMNTNYDIYKVILGERPRFYYDFSKK
ncbi:chitobiase/beta-hexosaminidase C-terminal domain-containing protein [Paenibacillus alkalitolerans]|uniref:chitobiase/beta-hexosaminidase C-terminal domain-containing protein n=1 Tax=Paenibacillus alkalitolerans TaxID=2799335 RepID=UPI0018F5A785|nr:chitobiase/beta-hexosaminidase C-terminal domain-containing protein [Paenibacillus alkalitolerans]